MDKRAVFTNYNDYLKRRELKEIIRYNSSDISSNTSINNYDNINNEFFNSNSSGSSNILDNMYHVSNETYITKIKNYSDYNFYNRHKTNLKILNSYNKNNP